MQPDSIFPGEVRDDDVAEFSGPPCECGEAPCRCSDNARILDDMADLIRELKPGWDVFDPEWLKNKRASWPIVRLQGALMGIRGNIRATGRKC